jgi:hypothetical protein
MGRKWTINAVIRTILQTKYMGIQIWGRHTEALSTPPRPVPRENWVVSKTGFEPIVSKTLFNRAQKAYSQLTHRLTNKEMLEKLREILHEHGQLNRTLIDQTPTCPGLTTYYNRFGGLRNIYAQLGLISREESATALLSRRQRMLFIRDALVKQILEKFPDRLSTIRRNRRFRIRFKFRSTGLLISVAIGRCHATRSDGIRWTICIPKSEQKYLAIVALLNEDNDNVRELWVMPHTMYSSRQLQIREGSDRFSQGERVGSLDDLLNVVNRVQRRRRLRAA